MIMNENLNLTKEKQNERKDSGDDEEAWGQPPFEGGARQHADEEAGGVQDHRQHAARSPDVRMWNLAHENWTRNQIASTCVSCH